MFLFQQDDDNIYYCWFARNAEGGRVKRFDGCHKINCTFPRKFLIISEEITNDLQ